MYVHFGINMHEMMIILIYYFDIGNWKEKVKVVGDQ